MSEAKTPSDNILDDGKSATPDQFKKIAESFTPDQLKKIEDAVMKALDLHLEEQLKNRIPQIAGRLGITPELQGLMQLLAARSNDSKAGVLEKALTLYGVALDAREKGNRLAILDRDDMILHDIIGFDPVEDAARQVAGRG